MKKIILSVLVLALLGSGCTKKQFSDAYPDPLKLSATTVERQFAGVLSAPLNYVMYHYWDYFVVYQNTLIPWSQTAVTLNTNGRYIPGAAAISDFWTTFYKLTAQYKDLLRVNAAQSTADQQANRIYILAATIFYYDYTQKGVDLWGDIPWTGAGLLGTTGGDYQSATASAKYDNAATIYTKMLDDLKVYADELNTITVPSGISASLKTQDFLNHGDLKKWRQYCNSLRLRLLTRVSGVASFQSRAGSEIASIVGNPTAYPLVLTNEDNIMVKVVSTTSPINNGTGTGASSDFYTGLIGWGQADRGNKVMIDFMNTNADPRLRAMFEPGDSAKGDYIGLDPNLSSTDQNKILNSGVVARYNRSTLSQNNYLPGVLINAAEVHFMLAEYYLKAGNDGSAKTEYEAGITQSVKYYYYLRTLSNSSISGALAPLGATEISDYLSKPDVSWAAAASAGEKLNRIATQKWITYSVLQPMEAWAEIRRIKLPSLVFLPDAGTQSLPPARWLYPTNELTYNSANYEAVRSKDNLKTRIFWDVK